MATVTTTVAINAAFLQEIKEDNLRLRQLLIEVREAFEGERPMGTRRTQVAELLGQLRDQLATHFTLEEAFGYFDDPVSVAPRLSEEADALRQQHRDLFVAICEIVEEAQQRFTRPLTLQAFRAVAIQFFDFDHWLRDHEARENDLIMRAFDEDIGVGD